MRILVFCEARRDHELATALAERVLREKGPAWLGEHLETQPDFLEWSAVGESQERKFTPWKEVKALAAAKGLRTTRRSGGEAAQAHKALQLAAREEPCEAVFLVRDLDNQPERREALRRERDDYPAPSFEIVLATPDPESEAWILHGFEPKTEKGRATLNELSRDLGFDPRLDAHRLRGDKRHGTAPRDIKEVLRKLTEDSGEEEKSSFFETPLELLVQRGRTTHLVDFLEELESRLLPRLAGSPAAKR